MPVSTYPFLLQAIRRQYEEVKSSLDKQFHKVGINLFIIQNSLNMAGTKLR